MAPKSPENNEIDAKLTTWGPLAVLLTRTLEQGPGQGQGLESVITQNAK